MRASGSFSLLCLTALLLAACGGGPQTLQSTSECDIPDWYASVPVDPSHLLAARTAVSQDMQLALDKAVTDGRAEIARQTDVRVQGLQKRFDEEVGLNTDAKLMSQFTQANKTVVSTSLSGSRVRSQELCQDGAMWRAYVLVEYPIGAANEALVQQIRKSSELMTRLRACQTFKELEADAQKYEESKKEPPPAGQK